MNRRIKRAFDDEGIEFQTKAAKIEAPPGSLTGQQIPAGAAVPRDELRAIVREVVEEMSRTGRTTG
jgi:hypothetical protein